MNDPRRIAAALEAAKTIAVVGCSPNPARASQQERQVLLREGHVWHVVSSFQIFGVELITLR